MRTDMTKLTVTFRKFANAPKNINKTFRFADLSGLRPRVQNTVENGPAGPDKDRWTEFEYKRVTTFNCLAKTNEMNTTTVLQRNFESYSDSLKRSVFPVTHVNKYRHIVVAIIIIIVGTTTHRQPWPPSKFPPPFPPHGCCPPATYSQHLQILPTSSLHLARGLPTFIVVQVAGTSVS